MMLGFLLGSPIGGRLGDRFGRKPTLCGALVIFELKRKLKCNILYCFANLKLGDLGNFAL
jgi:MFS family permease